MAHETSFTLKRFFLLLRNDLYLNRHLFFITAVVIEGVLVFLQTWRDIKVIPSFYTIAFHVCLFSGGVMLIWKLSSDLPDEMRNSAWMTLPASLMEKFACRITLSTILYPCAVFAVFSLSAVISQGIGRFFSWPAGIVFDPSNPHIPIAMAKFAIIQSVFLLGSVYFKKYSVIKTAFSMVLYYFAMLAFFLIMFNLFFGTYIDGFIFTDPPLMEVIQNFLGSSAGTRFLSISGKVEHIVFWYLILPVCWVTGYIRLKETEI